MSPFMNSSSKGRLSVHSFGLIQRSNFSVSVPQYLMEPAGRANQFSLKVFSRCFFNSSSKAKPGCYRESAPTGF